MKTLLLSAVVALTACRGSAPEWCAPNCQTITLQGAADGANTQRCEDEGRHAEAGTNIATYNACMKDAGLHE